MVQSFLEAWHREVPLAGNAEAGRAQGKADLVFERGGEWRVVEFKTDRLEGPDALVEYAEQLGGYSSSLAGVVGAQPNLPANRIEAPSGVKLGSDISVTIKRMIGLDNGVPYSMLSPVLTETGSLVAMLVLITALVLDSQRYTRRIVEWVPTTRRLIAAELCFVNWLVVTLVLMGDTGPRDFIYFRF